jgi:acyl-CoA thioesterase
MDLPNRIVAEMMRNDFFSQWLGIVVESVSEGNCKLKMVVRNEMANGFGIAHGGIAFSLADSALAFASNSRNRKSLVIETSVSFTSPVKVGDELMAAASELNLTKRTGVYQVIVSNSTSGKVVAHFKGVVIRKDDLWFPEGE